MLGPKSPLLTQLVTNCQITITISHMIIYNGIGNILKRVKEEEVKRRERMEKEIEERRIAKEKLRTEKEKKEEEKRREKVRRRERMEKQKRLQTAWEDLRWIHKYIEENMGTWELEKIERDEERRRQEEEWDKAQRFERIAFLEKETGGEGRRKKEGRKNNYNLGDGRNGEKEGIKLMRRNRNRKPQRKKRKKDGL